MVWGRCSAGTPQEHLAEDGTQPLSPQSNPETNRKVTQNRAAPKVRETATESSDSGSFLLALLAEMDRKQPI